MSLKTQDLFNVTNKVVVVTGGSRGIGEMITSGFLANGSRVYITARKEEALISKAEELSQKYDCSCIPVSGDISVGIQGFLIENGLKIQPVESVTLSGNFFDVLLNIQASGDVYQPELTNSFIPALLIEGLTVSG